MKGGLSTINDVSFMGSVTESYRLHLPVKGRGGVPLSWVEARRVHSVGTALQSGISADLAGSWKGRVGLEGMMPRRQGRKEEEEKNIPEKGKVC